MILFLDRDGVINRDLGYTYIFDPEIVYEDIAHLKKLNFSQLFIVTNQSGIGRGYYTEADFHKFMNGLSCFLQTHYDLSITDYFFCPHVPNPDGSLNCRCRKPNTGMFEAAISKYGLNVRDAMMIGDKETDIMASMAAGFKMNYLLDREGIYSDKSEQLYAPGVRVIKTLRHL